MNIKAAAEDKEAKKQKRIRMLGCRMADALHDGDEGVFEQLKKDAVAIVRGPDSNFNPDIYVMDGSPCIWVPASMVDAAGKEDLDHRMADALYDGDEGIFEQQKKDAIVRRLGSPDIDEEYYKNMPGPSLGEIIELVTLCPSLRITELILDIPTSTEMASCSEKARNRCVWDRNNKPRWRNELPSDAEYSEVVSEEGFSDDDGETYLASGLRNCHRRKNSALQDIR